jgi:Flp pilus assembly protein TadG
MTTALLAIPLIAMMGLAVDLSRVWLVRSRLQMSLDAAALVAARDIGGGGTAANGLTLFWANFNRNSSSTKVGYLGATATDPVVTATPGGVTGSVKLASTATINPTLLGVLGIGPVTVSGAATAVAAASGLELALVLDNTGSMAGSSMTSLIAASKTLLDILYGSSNDTQPKLWVSVVPFAATLNIGSTHANWLVSGAIDQTPYRPSKWMGCVMARTTTTAGVGDDFNDAPPSPGHYFTPFLYASTYNMYPTPAGIQYTTGSGSTRQTHTYWYPGDNDWQPATWQPTNNEPDASNNSVGPNLACPSLAILPETASKAAVLAVTNKMVPVYRGGTIISLGLQAGWWTLSPNWRGLWGDPNLPLAYNTNRPIRSPLLPTRVW